MAIYNLQNVKMPKRQMAISNRRIGKIGKCSNKQMRLEKQFL